MNEVAKEPYTGFSLRGTRGREPIAFESRLAEPIDSDTFTSTGRTIGYGCWGIVDEYRDPSDRSWAIKRFCPTGGVRPGDICHPLK